MKLRHALAVGVLLGPLAACCLPGGGPGPTPHAAITITADPASPVEGVNFTITFTNTGDADDTAPLQINIGSQNGLPTLVTDGCGSTTVLAQGASCSNVYNAGFGPISFSSTSGATTTPGSLQIVVQTT